MELCHEDFISAILPICLVAPPGHATVPEKTLRDRLVVCSQLVIHDPGARIIRDFADDCCRSENRIRDCHLHNWGG
jgi:hypothetical protein